MTNVNYYNIIIINFVGEAVHAYFTGSSYIYIATNLTFFDALDQRNENTAMYFV